MVQRAALNGKRFGSPRGEWRPEAGVQRHEKPAYAESARKPCRDGQVHGIAGAGL